MARGFSLYGLALQRAGLRYKEKTDPRILGDVLSFAEAWTFSMPWANRSLYLSKRVLSATTPTQAPPSGKGPRMLTRLTKSW